MIFQSEAGRPLDPATVWAVFQTHLRDSGLPRMTLYSLRDTATTTMLASGIDAKTISERLGHSGVAMTLRIYSHGMTRRLRDAAERLEDVYEQAGTEGGDVSFREK